LTREEEAMFDGEHGEAVRKAMEIIVTLGDIYGAKRMIRIGSAHVAGAGYKSIGQHGLEFLEEFANLGAQCSAFTTMNPPGVDVEQAQKMGVPIELVEKQLRILEAYRRMGVTLSRTCTPYLIGNVPRMYEHIAWSESSAVTFANSVLGAYTNRESAISALAAAITGKTPLFGYHLDENRYGKVLVTLSNKADPKAFNSSDYSVIGQVVGKNAGGSIPVFTNLPVSLSISQLKALSASLAVGGAIALFHVVGVTPNTRKVKDALGVPKHAERLVVEKEELKKTREELSTATEGPIDAVCIGCPHCTLEELIHAAMLLKGRKVHDGVRLWVCSAKPIQALAESMGYVEIIERAGGVVSDVCMPATAPLDALGIKVVATNSAKAAFYVSGSSKAKLFFGNMQTCIDAGVSGELKR
jgi:predicted aconitase